MDEQLIESLFGVPGSLLESFVNRTGLRWGITKPADVWHRSPAFHIFEAAVFAPIAILLWAKFFHPYVTREHLSFRVLPKPPMFSDMILGTVLALCFASQVVFKAMRPNAIVQLMWLLMPCHVVTAAWAWVLLQRPGSFNMTECKIAATMLTMSGWTALLGMATPDWSDHRYSIEGVVFYVHHALLVYIPFHWALMHGSRPLSLQLIISYFFPCVFGNYFVYTPVAYLSGNNANYNLAPPPPIKALAAKWGVPAMEKYYRFWIPFFLVASGCIFYAVVLLVEMAWRRFRASRRQVVAAEPTTRSEAVPAEAEKKSTYMKRADSAAVGSVKGSYINPGGIVHLPKGAVVEKEQKPVPTGEKKKTKKN